jgi:hypothetical protein
MPNAASEHVAAEQSPRTRRRFNRGLWTVLAVIVPGVLTAAALVWGIFQFRDQQALANSTAETANKTEFLKKQLEVTMDASDTVAILATTDKPDEWENARRHFYRLFWGNLSAVEDITIEGMMVEINQVLPNSPPTSLPMLSLEPDSRALALLVRDLALRSWRVTLDNLPPRSQPGSAPASTCLDFSTNKACSPVSDPKSCFDINTKKLCKS